MIETTRPMPSVPQRLAAFFGFCFYLITQVQVDAHKADRKRAQLLEARPMPGPAVTPLEDWGMDLHYTDSGLQEGLHAGTPHIHRSVAGADVWPHTHDG